jgi:tetratricopeptide (TPR) repeat protein
MGDVSTRTAAHRAFPPALVALTAGLSFACATGHVQEVSPAEIPELEQQLSVDPNNGDVVLRYAAALFSAQRCDSATVVARTGARLKPQDALGPLVIGQCLEQAGDYEQAISVYQTFLDSHRAERGAAAVGAREMLATRAMATEQARAALQRESELAQVAGDPDIVAVLPLEVVGDSAYAPLSRGLAQILISDLALLQRFRMVERLQVGALLDEMSLTQSQRVDPSTAARVGQLLQAGRLVQGLAALPSVGDARLEATVVLSTGEITRPESFTGRVRDLMRMEKDLVVAIATQLGYQLSEAERRLILENGTQSLIAFLAFSRGLEAEDAGNFTAATAFYAEAVREDPNFDMARDQHDANAAAPAAVAATPATVTIVAVERPPDPIPIFQTEDVVSQAIDASVIDVAATSDEQVRVSDQTQTTTNATTSSASRPPATVSHRPPTRIGTVRIVFRLP